MRQNSNSFDKSDNGLRNRYPIDRPVNPPNIRPVRNNALVQDNVPLGILQFGEIVPPVNNSAPSYIKSNQPMFYGDLGMNNDMNHGMFYNAHRSLSPFNFNAHDGSLSTSYINQPLGPSTLQNVDRINSLNNYRGMIPVVDPLRSKNDDLSQSVFNMNHQVSPINQRYMNIDARYVPINRSFDNVQPNPFICKYCAIEFGGPDSFKSHYMQSHREKIYDLRNSIPIRDYLLCKCEIAVDRILQGKLDVVNDVDLLELIIDELSFSLKTRRNIAKFKSGEFNKENSIICCNVDKEIFDKHINGKKDYLNSFQECINTLHYVVPCSPLNFDDIKSIEFDEPIDINLTDYPKRPAFFFIAKIDRSKVNSSKVTYGEKSNDKDNMNIGNVDLNIIKMLEDNMNIAQSDLVPLSFSMGLLKRKGKNNRLFDKSNMNVNAHSSNINNDLSNNVDKNGLSKMDESKNCVHRMVKIRFNCDMDKDEPNRSSPRFGKDNNNADSDLMNLSNDYLKYNSKSKIINDNLNVSNNSQNMFNNSLYDDLSYSFNHYPNDLALFDNNRVVNLPPSQDDNAVSLNKDLGRSKGSFSLFNTFNSRNNSRGNSLGLLNSRIPGNNNAFDLDKSGANKNIDIACKDNNNNDAPKPCSMNDYQYQNNIDINNNSNNNPLPGIRGIFASEDQNNNPLINDSSSINNNNLIDNNSDHRNASNNIARLDDNTNKIQVLLGDSDKKVDFLGDALSRPAKDSSNKDNSSSALSSNKKQLTESERNMNIDNFIEKHGNNRRRVRGEKKSRKKKEEGDHDSSSSEDDQKKDESSNNSRYPEKKRRGRGSRKGKK